jgi:hypothetical protein
MMMAQLWHKIVLSAEDIRRGKLDALQNEFTALMLVNQFPEGLSMVQREENAESATFYIPPSSTEIARDLIQRYNGSACSAPTRSEVAQYIGPISKLPFADN